MITSFKYIPILLLLLVSVSHADSARINVKPDKVIFGDIAFTVPWLVKTTTYIAVAGDNILANTTGGIFTITLPAGIANAQIRIIDYNGNFGTAKLTIAPNGSEKINGIAGNMDVTNNWSTVTLIYIDSTIGWRAF